MANKPVVKFLLPERLFKDERTSLHQTIVNRVKRELGVDRPDALSTIPFVSVQLNVIANKPINTSLTQQEISKIMKKVFTNAKVVLLDQDFTRSSSPQSLPIIEFRLFI